MGLVGLGALRLGQSGLSGLNKEWVKSLASNPNSLKLIEMAERGGASSASKPMVSAWLQKIAIESSKEIGEEMGQEGITAVAEKALKQANLGGPMASMLLAASMGMAQGKVGSKLLGRVQGDHLYLDPSAQDNVVESLRASGHFVETLPDGSYAASSYDRPSERLQISVMKSTAATDLLPNARLFAVADGRKTELDPNRPTLDLPNEKIVERDSVQEVGWEPSAYSVEVRRTIQEWSTAMADGNYEKALKLAQSGKHEPTNTSENGMESVPITPTNVRVEIDYAKLKDVNSEDFRKVLMALHQPGGKSCEASVVPRRSKEQNNANDEIRKEYGFRVADPVIKVPAGTEVEVAGKAVKLETDKEIALAPQEHHIDAVSKALQTQIKESEAGQRMLAEQAVIAMEERLVHLSQFRNQMTEGGLDTLSPTLAQFLFERADISPVGLRALVGLPTAFTDQYREMEVAALLYDSGFKLADIQSMLGNRHGDERKPLYDWLSAKNESGRRASTSTGVETETDRTIQEYVKELSQASPAQTEDLKAKITRELADKGREYAAKLGLVTRDASGNITDYMISERNIVLTQEGDHDSYNPNNTIEINLKHSDPTSALWHEMKHMSEMLARTSLHAADPKAFERRLREDVFGELAQGGDLRIIQKDDGKLDYEERTELKTFEQRSNLKSLLMDYTENNSYHSRQQVDKWLEQQSRQVDFFAQQGINKDALSKLISAELAHYEQVRESATLDAQVLYRDPKLVEWTEANAQHYRKVAEARKATLYDEPQLHKLTRGITEETLGIAGAPGHYNVLSAAERRANAAELTRNIQTLTTQINSQSAINATVSMLQFNSTTQTLTRALGKLRSDSQASPATLSQAREAAADLVTMLPDNEAGKNVAARLVGMNLIDAKQVSEKLLTNQTDTTNGDSPASDGEPRPEAGKRLSQGHGDSAEFITSKIEADKLNHKKQLSEATEQLKPYFDPSDPEEAELKANKIKEAFADDCPKGRTLLTQLQWLAKEINHTASPYPKQEIADLVEMFPYSATKIAAYMSGVRDQLGTSDFKVFLHGTNQRLATNALTNGVEAFDGNLFVSSAMDVGRTYAISGDNKHEPAIIGIAVPNKLLNELMKSKEFIDKKISLYLNNGKVFKGDQLSDVSQFGSSRIGPEYMFTEAAYKKLKGSVGIFSIDRSIQDN
jgi:hypothetical protein